ncbi:MULTISPECIES: hypothetical protein [unclassified Streptomyces]|uniref:hypothetical protein n=1 Tax=unclassified Streptomyces TaxID=2593676 RepID=UPI0036EAD5A3
MLEDPLVVGGRGGAEGRGVAEDRGGEFVGRLEVVVHQARYDAHGWVHPFHGRFVQALAHGNRARGMQQL